MKKETESEAIERRKKTYGCDGLCYGGINEDGIECHICGGIDTCEETRMAEGLVSMFVAAGFIVGWLLVAAFTAWSIYHTVKIAISIIGG